MAIEGAMPMRGVNSWAHIRNWYEVHSLDDNRRLLEDMAEMGLNDMGIVFERELFANYLDERTAEDNGREFWHKMKELARRAHELGMTVSPVTEVNTVFTDQWGDPGLSHLLARPGPHWPKSWAKKNYLFCPSQPEARALLLRDHERTYKDFPIIDNLLLWPYDPSGCGCEQCLPWPKTFFELGGELAALARRYHPQAAVYLSAWDMNEEEVGILIDLLNRDSSGTFQGILDKEWLLLDIAAGQPTPRWARLDRRYRRLAFIDLCQIGAWGWHCFTANPHPTRYEAMFKAMRAAGIDHYTSYSEDIHDDINKYLIAGLGKYPEKTARELIREYAVRYYQAAVGDDLYEICCRMEEEYTNKLASPWVQKPVFDLEAARRTRALVRDVEARLPAYAVRSWRWQVIAARAEMGLLINEIGDLEQTKVAIEGLFRRVLEVKTAEEAHDMLQQADDLIQGKKRLLEQLKCTVDTFRVEVLQEPGYRTIRVHSALPSYYDWHKMLLQMEETVGLATRIFVNSVQDVIRQRLGISDEDASEAS